MKIIIIFALTLVTILLFFKHYGQRLYVFQGQVYRSMSNIFTPERPGPKVIIGYKEIFVEVASNEDERNKGLSGRVSLPENEGMLFLYETEGPYSFWMKEMLISIDIIWIKDGNIVHIDKNLEPPNPGTPDEKLKMYFPPVAVDQVLEVNAGFTQKYDIKIGDSVTYIAN